MILVQIAKQHFLIIITLFFFCLNSLADQINSYEKSYYGSILAGQIANYDNEIEKASFYYNYANEINPKNVKIYNLTLMSHILTGKVDTAIEKIKYYEKSFKNSQYKSQVSNFLVLIDLISSSKKKEALEYLEENKEILITDKVKPLLKAWLSDSFEQAVSYLQEYEYKSEGLFLSSMYFQHLALIANFFGEKKKAYEAFTESLENFTLEKTRTLYFYSIFISNNSEFSDDNSYLEEFRKKNSEHSFSMFLKNKKNNDLLINDFRKGISELLYNLAETLYGQGMNETSIAFSQVSLFLNKNSDISNYLLAENFQLLGKQKKAIEILKKISLQSYLGWNSHLKIADLYLNLKKYDEAKDYLLKLKSKKKNRIDIYYKLGELYHLQKDYAKAISSYTTGIKFLKNPEKKHWYIFYSRGMSFERSKKWIEAEKDFLYALELFPNQPLVLNYLGYSWIDFGRNLQEAQELIKKAVKLRPNDGYFIDSLGWAFYRMGDYKNAVIELEKAVEKVPNDPIINDHLGDALWRAGFENEAIFQWKRALIYNPENELKEIIIYKLEKGL